LAVGRGALVLGAVFFGRVLAFAGTGTVSAARQVFRSSVLYLPAFLLLFVLDARLFMGR
jgi:hypothetical protein